MKMKKLFKEEESMEILKFLVQLKIYDYCKNMVEENISQDFRLKNIDEAKNYFVKKIEQNKLVSKKRKMVCTTYRMLITFLF